MQVILNSWRENCNFIILTDVIINRYKQFVLIFIITYKHVSLTTQMTSKGEMRHFRKLTPKNDS